MHNEKDNNSKGTANTRTKLSPIAIVLIVIAVIALFSVIIAGAVSSNNKKSGDNTVGMTLTEKNLKPQNNSSNNSVADRSLTKVEILMDDTAVVVGTTFKAAAVVEPENTDKALVWSSSNEDIMKVDSDGVVTVNNVGVAALTATVGDVSDAVAIEGIKSVSAGSAMDMLYTQVMEALRVLIHLTAAHQGLLIVAHQAERATHITVRQEAMMMVTAVVQIMVVLTEAILQMIHLIIQMGLITIIQAIPLTIQALIHRIPIALTQEAAVHQLETVTE